MVRSLRATEQEYARPQSFWEMLLHNFDGTVPLDNMLPICIGSEVLITFDSPIQSFNVKFGNIVKVTVVDVIPAGFCTSKRTAIAAAFEPDLAASGVVASSFFPTTIPGMTLMTLKVSFSFSINPRVLLYASIFEAVYAA